MGGTGRLLTLPVCCSTGLDLMRNLLEKEMRVCCQSVSASSRWWRERNTNIKMASKMAVAFLQGQNGQMKTDPHRHQRELALPLRHHIFSADNIVFFLFHLWMFASPTLIPADTHPSRRYPNAAGMSEEQSCWWMLLLSRVMLATALL